MSFFYARNVKILLSRSKQRFILMEDNYIRILQDSRQLCTCGSSAAISHYFKYNSTSVPN